MHPSELRDAPNEAACLKPPGLRRYEYDQAGNLIAVQRPETKEVPAIEESYAYDGAGLRASQTVSGTTSHLAWDESGDLPLLLNDGQASYIYGPGGLPIEQISSEGAPTYYQPHPSAPRPSLAVGERAGGGLPKARRLNRH